MVIACLNIGLKFKSTSVPNYENLFFDVNTIFVKFETFQDAERIIVNKCLSHMNYLFAETVVHYVMTTFYPNFIQLNYNNLVYLAFIKILNYLCYNGNSQSHIAELVIREVFINANIQISDDVKDFFVKFLRK